MAVAVARFVAFTAELAAVQQQALLPDLDSCVLRVDHLVAIVA